MYICTRTTLHEMYYVLHVVHTTCMYVHMYVQYYMTYLVANSMQKRFQLVIHDDFVKTILITIYFLTNNMLVSSTHVHGKNLKFIDF